ncbi:MAG: response regulator [Bradyrhizobium sp.]
MRRILVIDDDQDVRAMISIVLRVNHFEVVEAASACAGLQAFAESSFDVVMVDVFLQGANGFDVIAAMRERVADLPVIAMSGIAMLSRVSRSVETANVACLQKPFRPNQLVGAIAAAGELVGRRASAEMADGMAG